MKANAVYADAAKKSTVTRLAATRPEVVKPPEEVPVCVATGDGIGPEITESVLQILDAAATPLLIREVAMGLSEFSEQLTSGVPEKSWSTIRETGVLLKGPMTTPQGGGMKSLNVTLRKSLGLYANVRPVKSYTPFVRSHYPDTDLVIIRENEEDLYAGIEHRQTQDVVQCLKLVSRPGCERIVRYAFEYAQSRNRSRVTCMTKDNIMKLTDGLFHEVFEEVAAEYPNIEADHMIVDIGMARVAASPHSFDVIVTPNLYGDIVSDIAAEVTGSVGLAPSANIGEQVSVFEAIHGSAPDIAGRDLANPSGLLLAGVKMLAHLGMGESAELIHHAWLATMEDGLHTADIYQQNLSQRCVGTKEFTGAVISRLGQTPKRLKQVSYPRNTLNTSPRFERRTQEKKLVGVDVFVHADASPSDIAEKLNACVGGKLSLALITNRGVQVWPQSIPETFCTDHWRCRFQTETVATAAVATAAISTTPDNVVSNKDVVELLSALQAANIDFVKTEHLFEFDGKPGYSLAQGQ